MILRILLFSFFCLIAPPGVSQNKKDVALDIDELIADEDKPLILFFTAEWCRYCNAMKHDVFGDDSIASVIKEDFIYIEIDETFDKKVMFEQTIYSYFPTGLDTGYHEFISRYAKVNGKVSYPTLSIIYKGEEVFKYTSYLDREKLLKILEHLETMVNQD